MNTEQMSVEDLIPYTRNAKKHDERQIKNVMESIKQFGFAQPLVVDKNNVLIIGHCRLIAAKRLGLKEVPVLKMEQLTEEQAQKLRLLDNKLNESEWDMDLLLEDVPELDWSDFDIDWDLPEIDADDAEVIEDEAPEPPEEPKTKPGYLYQLGRHRLLCGDATSIDDLEKLMGGQKADLYLTDPPYNVALGMSGSHPLRPSEAKQLHRRTDGKIIQNDSWENDEEFIEFLKNSFTSALLVIKEGAAFYIWYADTQALNFRIACRDVGMQIRENLIWNKSVFAFGRQDYQWKHEPCLYGWKDGGSHAWYSDRKQTTVLDFEKPSKNAEHPTMKPVKLFDYLIKNSSKKGDIVFDSFGGSGTTIIACEQNGRSGYSTELDPIYCDVIVQRYVNLKGSSDDVFLIDGDKKIPYAEVFNGE